MFLRTHEFEMDSIAAMDSLLPVLGAAKYSGRLKNRRIGNVW
jgi:hypothetical protein